MKEADRQRAENLLTMEKVFGEKILPVFGDLGHPAREGQEPLKFNQFANITSIQPSIFMTKTRLKKCFFSSVPSNVMFEYIFERIRLKI